MVNEKISVNKNPFVFPKAKKRIPKIKHIDLIMSKTTWYLTNGVITKKLLLKKNGTKKIYT